jgi:hypothetical protein
MSEIFTPFVVVSGDDSRLKSFGFEEDEYCAVLVEIHPNGKIARILGTDQGEPEDKSLWRDFSWVPDILNEYYASHSIESGILEDRIKELENQLKEAKELSKNLG